MYFPDWLVQLVIVLGFGKKTLIFISMRASQLHSTSFTNTDIRPTPGDNHTGAESMNGALQHISITAGTAPSASPAVSSYPGHEVYVVFEPQAEHRERELWGGTNETMCIHASIPWCFSTTEHPLYCRHCARHRGCRQTILCIVWYFPASLAVRIGQWDMSKRDVQDFQEWPTKSPTQSSTGSSGPVFASRCRWPRTGLGDPTGAMKWRESGSLITAQNPHWPDLMWGEKLKLRWATKTQGWSVPHVTYPGWWSQQTRQHFHSKAFAFHSTHSQQNLLLSVLRKQTTVLQLPSAISLPLMCLHPSSLVKMNQLTRVLDPIPYLFCTYILLTVLYLKNKKAKQNKTIQLSSLFTLKTVSSRSWVVGARRPPCHSRSLERLPDFSKHI